MKDRTDFDGTGTTAVPSRPRFAIVRASALVSEGRWDAPFHIARKHHEPDVAALRLRYSDEEAIEILEALPLYALDPIKVLLRNGRTFNFQSATAAAREYPHLALALVSAESSKTEARLTSEIQDRQTALGRIAALRQSA